MKKIINKVMATIMVFAMLTTLLSGCKSKPKDADLKAAIETLLQTNPAASGTTVSVDKGIATLNGEVANELSKDELGKATAGVAGVKSVVNNLNITPSTAPVTIAMDEPLTAAVKDATKDYPTVSTAVSDGVIILKGEIQKADLQKLMMTLQALRPKKVDNTQLVIK